MNDGEGGFAARIGANVGEGSVEQEFLDGEVDISPQLLQPAAVVISASEAAVGIILQAGRINHAAIHNAENFADGDFRRIARQKITAIDAALAGKNATALQLEKNLLEIFGRNAIAFSDLMEGNDFRIRHGKMKDGPRCVLAFGGHSHGLGRVDFHRVMLVSTQETEFFEKLGGANQNGREGHLEA